MNIRRSFRGLPLIRLFLRNLTVSLICLAAFIAGSLFTLISVDPTKCNVQHCAEKMKQNEVEDSSAWLGIWGKEVIKKQDNVFLVILVLTAPGNVEQRNVIRQTWMSEMEDDVMPLFVIGSASLTDGLNTTIQSEQKRFKDLLMINSIIDSYQALTKKLLASLVFVHYHIKFRFLLKCDDDTFVQISQVYKELMNIPYKQRFYWGFFDGRATPKKTGPWKEREWILCDHYLPYALGGGYVLSSDLVAFVATNAKYLKLYNSEDVSLGTWLAPLDLHRVHDARFDTEYKSRGCHNDYLVTHKQSTLHMREKHISLKTSGFICKEQFKVRNSYKYNWNVPPSHCCVRNDSSIP
ncbi:beta-1,3-galactosyltransferase 6-like [Oratosquilla oratoria]|uniref:beta-1,3-galactosyltransferase 6-like n=1 Tax=Oratosquilla oratoria TaxID=337810 RepID=UPI003F7637FF